LTSEIHDRDEPRDALSSELASHLGLDECERAGLGAGLDRYAYLHASRAVLLRRLGRDDAADAADRRAADLPVSDPVRTLLSPE